jgi:hypothetical protein
VRARALAVFAALGILCGAAPPASKEDAALSAQLASFAQAQLDAEFLAGRDSLATSCPYALGSYSFIELSGIRRIYAAVRPEESDRAPGVSEVLQLTVQSRRARFYWAAGKLWVVGSPIPALHYFAEKRDGVWTFRAEQHLCARGEPQRRPVASEIPK